MLISIIIPTLNEEGALRRNITALQALRAERVEIIVVDGGSSDRTVDFAKAFADLTLPAPRGRARQMNIGAQNAKGEYLLFLHADTCLPAQIPDIIHHCYEQRVSWGFFRVRLSSPKKIFRVIESLINWRSTLTKVATGDQCIFVRRKVFVDCGGFREIPLMEDVALSKALKRLATPNIINTPVTTSSRRWEEHGIVKTILLMWRLRLLYFFGVSPQNLAKQYR